MIDSRLVQYFIDCFCNRTDMYYTQKHDGSGHYTRYDSGKHYWHGSLGSAQFSRHLAGDITLGLPSIDGQFHSKWCAWDSDGNFGYLPKIEETLRALNCSPIQIIGRPGREGHLFVLLDQKLPSADLLRFDKWIRGKLNIPIGTSGTNSKLEFYPKAEKSASNLRLPLGINRKREAHGAIGWFADCPERNVKDQLDWLAQQPLQDTSFIVDIANQQRLTEEAIERYCPKQPFYANLSLKPKTMKVYGASPGIIELCHQVGIPLTRIANDLRGPCPLCQEQSMDTHRDNLSIKANGTAFNCMEGGPGATHSAKEVYKKLLELRKSF